MKMLDYSDAFPNKNNYEPYLAVINGAVNAINGRDGKPRVVIEEYGTPAIATKAAKLIRIYSSNNKLYLRVSCFPGSKEIKVYKGKPRNMSSRKNKDETEPAAKPE